MNEAKNYTIRILNDEYVIQSDEQREVLDRAHHLVNDYMQAILQKSKHIDHKKAAVLAALRLATNFVHQEDSFDAIKLKEQELIEVLNRI